MYFFISIISLRKLCRNQWPATKRRNSVTCLEFVKQDKVAENEYLHSKGKSLDKSEEWRVKDVRNEIAFSVS